MDAPKARGTVGTELANLVTQCRTNLTGNKTENTIIQWR